MAKAVTRKPRSVRAFVERKDRRTGESYFVDNPRGSAGRAATLKRYCEAGKRAAREYRKHLRLSKIAAYRAATHLLKLQQEWPESLKEKIAPATLEEFVRKTYAPLIQLGGDPFELLRAVESGATLEHYLDHMKPIIPPEL